jgi:hypothetical protein
MRIACTTAGSGANLRSSRSHRDRRPVCGGAATRAVRSCEMRAPSGKASSPRRRRSAMTLRGRRALSSTGSMRFRRRRASAQSRSSSSARSGGSTEGSGVETGRKSAIARRSSSPVSTSRATTASKLMTCMMTNRRSPQSTSPPGLLARFEPITTHSEDASDGSSANILV